MICVLRTVGVSGRSCAVFIRQQSCSLSLVIQGQFNTNVRLSRCLGRTRTETAEGV